jgi:hypothetical protein
MERRQSIVVCSRQKEYLDVRIVAKVPVGEDPEDWSKLWITWVHTSKNTKVDRICGSNGDGS